MKLYKEQCSIDARHQFFSNRIIDIWNSLPAAVVLSPSVTVLNEIYSEVDVQQRLTLLLRICLYMC